MGKSNREKELKWNTNKKKTELLKQTNYKETAVLKETNTLASALTVLCAAFRDRPDTCEHTEHNSIAYGFEVRFRDPISREQQRICTAHKII